MAVPGLSGQPIPIPGVEADCPNPFRPPWMHLITKIAMNPIFPSPERNDRKDPQNDCGCDGACGSQFELPRRRFLKWAGAGVGTALAWPALRPVAGPFTSADVIDHFVPADKKLNPEWIESLYQAGSSTWYSGSDLETIGMPIGGICAGHLYLTGDGRLTYWDLFNQNLNSGYGRVNYEVGREPNTAVNGQELFSMPEVKQGVALEIRQEGRTWQRRLEVKDFPRVRFCGEYPMAWVQYPDESLPVDLELEAFSPFIPLHTEDSALPATLLNYRIRNRSEAPVEVCLAGWLENVVGRHSAGDFAGRMARANRLQQAANFTAIGEYAREIEARSAASTRPPVVFADFEGNDYGDWKVEGEAFGDSPARGTLEGQQSVSGFAGEGLVNTFLGGDAPTGRLISPEFQIERPWISFLIGGGGQTERTCINLRVGDEIVLSATGKNRERLDVRNWDVRKWEGRNAHLEIVDAASEAWGHVNIDQIEFRDHPKPTTTGALRDQPDFGSLALAVLGDAGFGCAELSGDALWREAMRRRENIATGETDDLSRALVGSVGRTAVLAPGEETTVTFVVAWCMPNLRFRDQWVGHYYGRRFRNAMEVAEYVAANYPRLAAGTRLWHDTFYESSLPHWLLDRLHSTVGNMATTTCHWWRNGRFWAWEGCGCCHGTCGHVWNYAHAVARLFPELERSVREMQDFAMGIGMREDGSIAFRGEDWNLWAGDAQGGYVLKAWREHLTSPDSRFLERNWKAVKRAVEFLIAQDGNADGLLEGAQHQTYDQNYYGANTMVGSLYLGALLAAEAMARSVGDHQFATQCREIFRAGQKLTSERLFNGEYFIQDVDLEKHPNWQYARGCLADQLFGQGWAHQVGLGYVYPPFQVRSALESIWKYCWAPDIGAQNEEHAPERWFAYPGEAGLFTCTWPKSPHLGPKSTRYRNEIWTGIEYQVAGHMVWEGMLTEALAICRGIHERYHPAKHNPWNEIECGDHYARSLAGWGVFLAFSGFNYHGSEKRIEFAPRWKPEDFRTAFTAAEGWGLYRQHRDTGRQSHQLHVRWGRMELQQTAFDVPESVRVRRVEARLSGEPVSLDWQQTGRRVRIRFPQILIPAPGTFEIEMQWAG